MKLIDKARERTKYINSYEGVTTVYNKRFNKIVKQIETKIMKAADKGYWEIEIRIDGLKDNMVNAVIQHFLDKGFLAYKSHNYDPHSWCFDTLVINWEEDCAEEQFDWDDCK